MRGKWGLFAALIVMGALWGLTQPLYKIAVSTQYRQFGLIFWQSAISAAILGAICLLRGRSFPMGRAQLQMAVVIAVLGTVLPAAAQYQALVYLPAGLVSILLSLIPMMAFPIALAMGNERFNWLRLLGLIFGLIGVLLIMVPQTSLPDRALVVFIPLAMIAPACYALEGNVVGKWGTAGLDPIALLLLSSVIACVLSAPLALVLGQWIDPRPPWGAADWAWIAGGVIHAAVYTSYVWLVGRTGPIFAVQVSYLVTGFGVLWAMLILSERYSLWIWAAFAVLLCGLALVQPLVRKPQ